MLVIKGRRKKRERDKHALGWSLGMYWSCGQVNSHLAFRTLPQSTGHARSCGGSHRDGGKLGAKDPGEIKPTLSASVHGLSWGNAT